MDSIVEESRRLQQHYASLTEDELLAVADDASDLTELARETLQAEITSRGLHVQLKDAPPSEPEETPDLAVVRRVWDREEARQVMNILRDAGIPAYLGPDDIEAPDSFLGDFEEGVDVKVRAVDRQRASYAVSQELTPSPEADAKAEYVAHCPRCHSTDIVFQGLDDRTAPESFATSKFNWRCDHCGYQWKDEGFEEET